MSMICTTAMSSDPSTIWAVSCVDKEGFKHLCFTKLGFNIEHGEAETRIQAQMFGAHQASCSDLYIQEANDSDYITLAAMSHTSWSVPTGSLLLL